MAYSLFDEDEKIKLNDTFNSLGFPTSSTVTESSKSSYDDIDAQNKALENIIARQNIDEQAAKDDYNSFGSRANRFVQVLGAGLMGENASGVAKDLRDNLNTRLTNIRSKYKDERDSAYQRVKDTLARREALNKLNYEKDRDKIKDEQWSKEQATKQDQFDRQMKYYYDRLNAERDAEQKKIAQATSDAEKALELQAQEKAGIEADLEGLFANLNPMDILPSRGEEEISSARINDINLKIAKNKFGKEGKEAVEFIKNNPSLFFSDRDSKDVLRGKAQVHGYKTPVDTEAVDAQKKKDAEYIKKLDKISGDPNKTNKLLSKYNNDPKAAYRAWMNKPKIFDTLD